MTLSLFYFYSVICFKKYFIHFKILSLVSKHHQLLKGCNFLTYAKYAFLLCIIIKYFVWQKCFLSVFKIFFSLKEDKFSYIKKQNIFHILKSFSLFIKQICWQFFYVNNFYFTEKCWKISESISLCKQYIFYFYSLGHKKTFIYNKKYINSAIFIRIFCLFCVTTLL